MSQEEYNESVSPARGKPIARGRAQDYGRRLRLACATFPIIGKNKITELKRSSEKRVLGSEWIFFMSEHATREDAGLLNTLRRGVKEEVNYKFRMDFYDPKDTLDISYCGEKEKFFWSTGLFVIPIRSILQLNPDEKEILDIRERDMDEVFRESRKGNSIYRGFKPELFIERLEEHTRYCLKNYKKF